MQVLETKHIRTLVLVFIAGIILTLIPTLLYISSLKDNIPQYKFIPNAISERKPVYIQIFKTQQEVEAIKKQNINLSDYAEIGAGVRMATKGLDMYLKKQLDGKDIHLEYIEPLESEKVQINGYTYIPNAILKVDPAPVQILYNEDEVNIAKNDKNMTYKENIEVGAVIQCPESVACYAISKSGVADRLIIKPYNSSKPKE